MLNKYTTVEIYLITIVQYEGRIQTIRTPFLHQTIRTFEIFISRKLSNQTQPDLAYPCV